MQKNKEIALIPISLVYSIYRKEGFKADLHDQFEHSQDSVSWNIQQTRATKEAQA